MQPLLLLASLACAGPLDLELPKIEKPVITGQAPQAAAPKQKEWTILLYSNGKNNLSKYIRGNLEEVAAIGSTPQINVVAQLGEMNGKEGVSRRFLVPSAHELLPVDLFQFNQMMKDPKRMSFEPPGPAPDMGSWTELRGFLRWASWNFPAKRYALIVANHGGGWKGISFDDESRRMISTPELARAIDESLGVVDLYVSDACLMQMAEVAYELKDRAHYIVGSEDLEYNSTYDYAAILRALAAKPDMSGEELAKVMVDVYAKSGKEGMLQPNYTSSALRASAMPKLRDAVNDWLAELEKNGRAGNWMLNINRTFYYEEYKDLHAFVDEIGGSEAAKAAGRRVQDVIEKDLVLANTHLNVKWAHGISVDVRKGKKEKGYEDLAWARDTRWKVLRKAD